WQLARERIGAQADDFFLLDDELRALGASALEAEMGFGFERDESGAVGDAVEVELPSGRTLRFRGWVDRVDRLPDGSVAVIDYKTVSRALSTDDIVAGLHQGRYLQLPLYARAATRRHGGDDATAAYWYLASRTPSAAAEVVLGDIDGLFLEALEVFTDGIASGRYPIRPGEATTWPRPTFEHCKWCDYDALCPAERDQIWLRQEADPRLGTYVELTSREPAVEDGAVSVGDDDSSRR
ncbi:MAG TPA: PD-(D/E)XK nuclease family protein, partial [Microthrixaceae bacterium]|nr:PD-(D/E)XK nuclease family protein [Microthrixaceae bacterium]